MLRGVSLLASLAVLTVPAAAQQANSSIDWSKPVVGVDSNVFRPVKDEPIPVEIYTIEDLKRDVEAATASVSDVPQKQAEPPCEPDRRPAADGRSEVLSVCPAQPPAQPTGAPR